MIRIFEYHNMRENFLLLPNEKEFHCEVCNKSLKFRGKSPYRCSGCAQPLPDATALMEDPETRASYHKFGEVAIIHADVLHTQPR